jgi:hypothetical protein
MSDGGNLTRDIVLRVRAQNLSTADFKQLTAQVNELTAAIDHQVEAAGRSVRNSINLRTMRSAPLQPWRTGRRSKPITLLRWSNKGSMFAIWHRPSNNYSP